MTRLLTPDQVTAYERDGFVFPVDVLTPAEVSAFRGELEASERQRGAPIDFPEKSKSYLLFDWADPMNMIRRGQGISDRFDHGTGTLMPVRAGPMSLHHTDLVHASGANDSDDRRIGFAISYLPAHVCPTGDIRPSALCVRGRDHGHFVPEERLREPLSDTARQRHAEALALFRARQDAGFQASATSAT